MLLAFEGIVKPVALIGGDDLVECFSAVLRGWRFTECASPPAPPPIITIQKTAKGYGIASPWRKMPSRASLHAGGAPEGPAGSLGPRFRRNPKVTETAIDRDVFLVDPDSQGIYHLNAVGTVLWRLLAEPIGVAQAAAILHRAFPEVSGAEIERDVAALLADLAARGLVSDAR